MYKRNLIVKRLFVSQNFAYDHAVFLPSSFQGCVATSGAIAGSRTVSLQWIAYRTVSNGAYEKKVSIPMWTTGTQCVREDFPKVSNIQQRGQFASYNIEIAKMIRVFAEKPFCYTLNVQRFITHVHNHCFNQYNFFCRSSRCHCFSH